MAKTKKIEFEKSLYNIDKVDIGKNIDVKLTSTVNLNDFIFMSSNEDVVSVEIIDDKIFIFPKSEGNAMITISSMKNNDTATSEVIIGNDELIKTMEVEEKEYKIECPESIRVEEEKTKSLDIKVYENDTLIDIPCDMSIEDSNICKVINNEVKGLKTGLTKIIYTLTINNTKVAENMSNIVVFDKEIAPPKPEPELINPNSIYNVTFFEMSSHSGRVASSLIDALKASLKNPNGYIRISTNNGLNIAKNLVKCIMGESFGDIKFNDKQRSALILSLIKGHNSSVDEIGELVVDKEKLKSLNIRPKFYRGDLN